MKLKYKVSILVIGILLVASLFISSSYALWVFNTSQEGTNVVTTDCFEVRFADQNPIKLEYAFPLEDAQGSQLTPYTFTITNVCNHAADFQVNLETLSSSSLAASNIKTDLNGVKALYSALDTTTPLSSSASSAVIIQNDTLDANTSKTFNLRLWIKDNAIQNEIENKTFESKITITSSLRKKYDQGTLISGSDFNVALKTLAGANNPTAYSSNTNITSIEKSLTAPLESDNAVNVAVISSKPIYAWFKNGVIYIYSENDTIYMNSDASFMFSYFTGLVNLDLGFLNTSNVTTMEGMFRGSKITTNFDISKFDTSKVTNMHGMFNSTSGITSLNLSNFDTSNVTDMQWMFAYMSDLTSLNISNLNTSKVENMASMFAGFGKLTNLDLSYLNTSSVKDMSYMFSHASKLTSLDLSNFDTSKVENMAHMFDYTNDLVSLNVSSFDTRSVTTMESMFEYATSIEKLDLSSFNAPNVLKMDNMFHDVRSLKELDVSNLNTSKVESMRAMFSLAQSLTSLDLSGFNTSRVKNMNSMFQVMTSLKTIYVSSNWSTASLTSSYNMFSNSLLIVGGEGTRYNPYYLDATYARVDDPTNDSPGYFTLKNS